MSPSKSKCSTLKDSSVQLDAKENLREADYFKVNEWAVSLKRPITFLVKRIQENIASLADDNIKGDHLKNIDIERAVNCDIFHSISFCNKCNNSVVR